MPTTSANRISPLGSWVAYRDQDGEALWWNNLTGEWTYDLNNPAAGARGYHPVDATTAVVPTNPDQNHAGTYFNSPSPQVVPLSQVQVLEQDDDGRRYVRQEQEGEEAEGEPAFDARGSPFPSPRCGPVLSPALVSLTSGACGEAAGVGGAGEVMAVAVPVAVPVSPLSSALLEGSPARSVSPSMSVNEPFFRLSPSSPMVDCSLPPRPPSPLPDLPPPAFRQRVRNQHQTHWHSGHHHHDHQHRQQQEQHRRYVYPPPSPAAPWEA